MLPQKKYDCTITHCRKINQSGPFGDFLFYVTLTTSYLWVWTGETLSIPNNFMQPLIKQIESFSGILIVCFNCKYILFYKYLWATRMPPRDFTFWAKIPVGRNFNVGKSSPLKKWQTSAIKREISYFLFFRVFWVAVHGRLNNMMMQYKKSCPQQMCLPRNSLIFRVYLGVRTCEVFWPFVFLGFIVLTSLRPLLYVTREFHRFFHRGWADPIFLGKLEREATGSGKTLTFDA